ncbi:Uncharacterised protein [Mycobacteroides abscessus subsp. abscessus]|nr:Uncharacterised protein [Mycobacteroides abscessus subsp. abscessus]
MNVQKAGSLKNNDFKAQAGKLADSIQNSAKGLFDKLNKSLNTEENRNFLQKIWIIILFLVIKLLGAILRHPFISLILFALGGFAIFKFALVGIIGVGVLAAAGAGALWLNTGDGS